MKLKIERKKTDGDHALETFEGVESFLNPDFSTWVELDFGDEKKKVPGRVARADEE